METTSLDPGALDAIIGGYIGAPFDVLGPHLMGTDLVIRTMQPDAAHVTVITSKKKAIPMTQIHPAGLFEAVIPGRKKIESYQLDIAYHNATTGLIDDPYAFPPTFTDFDSHLMAEGTHHHIYDRLGAHTANKTPLTPFNSMMWAPRRS